MAGATGSLVARSQRDGRDATLTFSIDLWNLTFPSPGDYSFRLLVNGSERKRLPFLLLEPPSDGSIGRRRRDRRPPWMTDAARTRPGAGTSRVPGHRRAGLVAARHADRLLAAAQDLGSVAGSTYLEPLPDRLRDDDLRGLRAAAVRAGRRMASKDSSAMSLPGADRAVPRRRSTGCLREINRATAPAGRPPVAHRPRGQFVGVNASSRNGDGTAGSYDSVRVRRARVHAT